MKELQTASLATEINLLHETAEAHATQAVIYAARCGAKLNEAKALVPHGEWMGWAEKHCPAIKKTQRANYMRLAVEHPELLDSNFRLTGNLPSIDGAIALLSAPDEVKETIQQKLDAGESVSVKEIEELKRQVKDAEEAKQKAELAKADAVGRLSGTQQMLDLMEKKYDEVRAKKEVVVEKEVEKIPADYEHLKRYVEQLKQEKQAVQEKIDAIHAKYKDDVKKGVSSYLQSHQEELDSLERRKEEMRKAFDKYQTGIAKFNAKDVEMRSHADTIDAANLAMAVLAAALSSFEFTPDETLSKKWRTLQKNLSDAAQAIEHLVSTEEVKALL